MVGGIRGVGKRLFAIIAQTDFRRQSDSRSWRPTGGYLITGYSDCAEKLGKNWRFVKDSQQQIRRFDGWTSGLRGLVPREENRPPCLFRVSLKHECQPKDSLSERDLPVALDFASLAFQV